MKAVTNSLEIPVIQNLNELSIALEQGKKKCDQLYLRSLAQRLGNLYCTLNALS
jgi:hypothetical protein